MVSGNETRQLVVLSDHMLPLLGSCDLVQWLAGCRVHNLPQPMWKKIIYDVINKLWPIMIYYKVRINYIFLIKISTASYNNQVLNCICLQNFIS